MRRILALPLLLCACDDMVVEQPACPPGFVDDGARCVFDEASVIDVLVNMDNGDLVRINDEPFVQIVGPQLMRNVWVSPVPLANGHSTAADLYRSIDPDDHERVLEDSFPVGTIIIHETVNREEGHTIQVKRDDYVDDLGRNWWFGKVYDDGTYDTNDCSPCWSCHSDDVRPNTEGLWGVTRDAL